ncbi:MAG: hypothetical protein P1P87_15640, partial [Trueperaceae bacterium]|nr:hypothetical protein [Trueperaceae bacterium]
RPCLVCSQVFTPHPRAGDRQKTCSSEACQRERHRRNCVDWHKRHEGYVLLPDAEHPQMS